MPSWRGIAGLFAVFFLFLFFIIVSVLFVFFFLGAALLIFVVASGLGLPVRKEFLLEVHDPRVLEHFDQRDSLVGLLFQELVHEVFVLLRDFRLKSYCLTSLVPGNRLLIPSKGCIPVH